MTIEDLDRTTKHITLTFNVEEIQKLSNLLCYVRRDEEEKLSGKDFRLCANILMAATLLNEGCLPAFELKKISELRQEADSRVKPIN